MLKQDRSVLRFTVCVLFCASFIILSTSFSQNADSAEDAKRIAVLELVNKAGITDDEAYALTDRVRMLASEILPAEHLTVMTGENIQELLPPGMDLAKCTTAECEVEMGRMIGAEYLITGEIIRFAGDLRINVRVHNSRTGTFIGGRTCDGSDVRQLENNLKVISQQLLTLVLSREGAATETQPGCGESFVGLRKPSPTEQTPATTEQTSEPSLGPSGVFVAGNSRDEDLWVDSLRGLTWQAHPLERTMNLGMANERCERSTLLGFDDWRLPTISELRTLIRGCPATQTGGPCKVTDSCLSGKRCESKDCEGCRIYRGPGPDDAYWAPKLPGRVFWYWSDSGDTDRNLNFTVDFFLGRILRHHPSDGGRVRCVRQSTK